MTSSPRDQGSPYSMGSIGKAPPSDDAHLGGMLTAEVVVEPDSLCRRVDGLVTSIARDRRPRYDQCRRNDKSNTGQD